MPKPPWKPQSRAAQTIGDALEIRVLEILHDKYPSAQVYQILLSEAAHPVILLLVPGPDGRLGAATCWMETEFSAERPEYHVSPDWGVA